MNRKITWLEVNTLDISSGHSADSLRKRTKSFFPVRSDMNLTCWLSPCSEGFSLGPPVLHPPQKTTSPNLFQFDQDRGCVYKQAIII